jgi:hypothetical protein
MGKSSTNKYKLTSVDGEDLPDDVLESATNALDRIKALKKYAEDADKKEEQQRLLKKL